MPTATAAMIHSKITNDNQVRVEKVFGFPAASLYKAIPAGRLFFNCSGDQETFENDFRVGGSYKVRFRGYGITNVGKYLELVPEKKLVFTWGDKGSDTQFPMSTVTIELFADGNRTRLVLEHKGFTTREQAEDHRGGWTGGLADLGDEIEKGQVRMLRQFKVSREQLFNACSNPAVFFGDIADVAAGTSEFRVGGRYSFPTSKGTNLEGAYLEIVPNERIVFSWEKSCGGQMPAGSRVELRFTDREGGSTLELLHLGLGSDQLGAEHHEGWDFVLNRLPAKVESAR